jgi:hypothetical protein
MSSMNQIGDQNSPLFALSPVLLARLEERIANGQLGAPTMIQRQGASGALVRFDSVDQAMLVKMAIV